MPRTRKEPAEVGDNSAPLGGESLKQLQALTERINALLDEREETNEALSEVFQEAADSGFDKKSLRAAIARKRKIDKNEAAYYANEEAIQAYFDALYQPDLPFEPQAA